MITELGIVAGEIWHTLDDTGSCGLEHLCAVLERPRELILMSLGWLCREGHVELIPQNQACRIRLRRRA